MTIGVAQNGKVPKSLIAQKDSPVDVLASGAIEIQRLTLKTEDDAEISTAGTTVDLLGSSIVGNKTSPTVTISAGPGSTCDVTGTVVKKATLVTSCDTVVGP